MFDESPFTGACKYATYEVLSMLAGTLALGLLLGYLIWGWLRRHVSVLQNRADRLRRIADLRQIQITSLTTRLTTVTDQLERAETKASLAEYKMRRAQDEIESVRDQMVVTQQQWRDQLKQTEHPDVHEKTLPDSMSSDMSSEIFIEPTLADISLAMETGTLDPTHQKPDASHIENFIPESLMKRISEESLGMAEEIFDRKIKANDLKLIHGIDQKTEDLLHRAGILSWLNLAQSRLPDLRRITEEAGPRYRTHDPKTWPIQARMAAKGEWKKLKAYQDALKTGGDE